MKRVLVLLGLVGLLLTACAPKTRYPGRYDRHDRVYTNASLGFRLTFPEAWAVTTSRQFFTVPLDLRPDQERVLEAYDPVSHLGVVIVIQDGPVAEIAQLVQRMQAMPIAQAGKRLIGPHATDVRQHSLRRITIQGQEVAEWVYTAKDTTDAGAVNMTVSYFILKLRDHYVYLAFAAPEAQYAATKPTIEAIVQTFRLVNSS
jgi:hypothetical protein